jgi:hypothetical protein
MKIAEAFVELRVDRKKSDAEAKSAASSALGVMRNVFAGGVVIAGLKKSIGEASDLNETISKTGVVFQDSAREITAWSTNSAKQLGLSQRAALDAASTFAVFGKSAGLAGSDLTGFATDLTGLASDLASFNNTSPEQAIEAIGAALRGESEPIRAYGVLLDDATLKQRAMTLGIFDGTGSLTQQQRVLAAQAEIMAQTGLAQGDFARTADGVANSQRIANAEAENAAASFGQVLLPVYDKVLEVVTFLVDKFADLPAPLQTAVVGLAAFAAFSGPIGTVKGVVTDLATALTSVAGGAGRAAVALGAVGGVLALAGGLYVAYTSDKRKAEQTTNDFVAALKAEASGQRDAVKALIARQIVDAEYLDNAEKLGLTQADIADVITGKNVPAFNSLRDSLEEVLDSTAAADVKTFELQRTFGISEGQARGFLIEIDRLATGYGSAQTETEKLAAAEAALGIATETTAGATAEAATVAADLTDATKATAEAQRKAADAADRQRAAIEDLYNEMIGQIDAQRAYERAVDDSETAVSEFDATLRDGESTLEDIDDAARNAADTIIDTAAAFAESKGAALDSKTGVDLMVESLYTQALALAPESPLRARLLEYIGELQKIPANIDTQIRLSVTGQTVTKDGDIIGVRTINGEPAKPRAQGGFIGGPEFALIGEAGDEAVLPLTKPNRLVELLGDPRIGEPIAQAMAEAGGGGGSTAVATRSSAPTFIVNAYGDREFIGWVRNEIHALERSES